MELLLIFIFGIIIILIIIGIVLTRIYEKKEWNNGTCPKCGGEFKLFDVDSQGGRMYRCDNWHFCDISYNVDKR